MRDKGKKNKKLTEHDGFTIGKSGALGLSLGTLLGAGAGAGEEGESGERAERPRVDELEARKNKKMPEAKITKISLQRQRAGRGGKTVTAVTLPRDYCGDIQALAKELRKGLGCGSSVEDGKIILQGDIADRIEAWFAKKGVKNISKG